MDDIGHVIYKYILFFFGYNLTLYEISALVEAPADSNKEENCIRSEDRQEIIKFHQQMLIKLMNSTVVLLTGYLTPNGIIMYWEIRLHNELTSSSIRKNKSFEIYQYLHTCDNFNLSEGDKFGKLRQAC